MSAWERLAGLPVEVERLTTERRQLEVSSGFSRVTTTVVLAGAGEAGRGEDVTYDPQDHDGYPSPDLRGRGTLAQLSRRLDAEQLFARTPEHTPSLDYRRWAFESAALDLALRQAGTSLGGALERPYRPVRFVVSTRLAIWGWLEHDPQLEFKLDPTPEWDDETIERLAATGRVRVLDLKAHYVGTVVDQVPDPRLYGLLAQRFPEAVIEDPALEGPAFEALRGQEGRISLDAPLHALADLERVPFPLRHANVKPSRFGTLERLLDFVEHCERETIEMYGGGQFELGVGREHIQTLASLFYAGAPNDVAPGVYNASQPRAGLPPSPLPPPLDPRGLSFG